MMRPAPAARKHHASLWQRSRSWRCVSSYLLMISLWAVNLACSPGVGHEQVNERPSNELSGEVPGEAATEALVPEPPVSEPAPPEPIADAADTAPALPDAGGEAGSEQPPEQAREVAADAPGKHSLDHLLRLNHIQVKGTHNSYHIAPKVGVTAWMYTHAPLDEQLGKHGVRQLELDLYWDDSKKRFEVYHLPLLDEGTHCRLFVDCLKVIKRWSDRHMSHIPIMILIEPKGISGYPNGDLSAVEKEINAVWPNDRLLTPDALRSNHASVREAVLKDGWPTLGKLRGMLTFAILLEGADLAKYTHGGKDLKGRLMFPTGAPGEPYSVIFSLTDPYQDAAQIQKLVKEGFLVRTRSDSEIGKSQEHNEQRHQAALQTSAQWLSTDFPARVTSTKYVATIPDGNPARCNPLTAPPECTSKAIEDL